MAILIVRVVDFVVWRKYLFEIFSAFLIFGDKFFVKHNLLYHVLASNLKSFTIIDAIVGNYCINFVIEFGNRLIYSTMHGIVFSREPFSLAQKGLLLLGDCGAVFFFRGILFLGGRFGFD